MLRPILLCMLIKGRTSLNMFVYLLVCMVVGGAVEVRSQPAECSEDSHCATGLYCEGNICHQCLVCEELRRQTPRNYTSCIKSVLECGACLQGLVYDPRGDVTTSCVSPSIDDESKQPFYVWLLVGIGVALVLAAVIVVLLWVYRHPDRDGSQLRINTSVHAPYAGSSAPASAPPALSPHVPSEPYHLHSPPQDALANGHTPYDAMARGGPLQPPTHLESRPKAAAVGSHHSPYVENGSGPPSQPSQPPPPYSSLGTRSEELSPLLKELRPAAARESTDHQRANMFNPPHYVHAPDSNAYDNVVEPEPTFTYIDETTWPSDWRADATNNNETDTNDNNTGIAEALEAAGATGTSNVSEATGASETEDTTNLQLRPVRRPSPPALMPPAKVRRIREDNNNNQNNVAGGSEEQEGSSAGPAQGSNMIVNVNNVFNINTSTVTLSKNVSR